METDTSNFGCQVGIEMYINNTVKNGGTVIIPSFAVSERKW
jgi:predicted metal-dependent RNase